MTAQVLQTARPGYDDGIARVRAIVVWLIFASSFIVIFEPAPCDIFAMLALTFFFLPGVKITPAVTPLLLLYFLLMVGYLASYYANGPDDLGTFFLFSTGYNLLVSFFLACLLSSDTENRFEIIKSGFVVGAVIAAIIALSAYINVAIVGTALFKLGASGLIFYGRATGAFKDPNVFSTYIIFPTVLVFQNLLLGNVKRPFISLVMFAVLFLSLFLAFSRGAWANFATACSFVILLTLLTTPSKVTRSRIFFYSLTLVGILALILTVLLSIPEVHTTFTDRFELIKKYDGGERGRFGNQLNAIPMLLQLPFGFGPYRFDRYFFSAPHNAFLNAFAAGGWLGGITYFTLVCCNIFVGLKSVFTRSPYQNYSILVFACLIAVTFQGIQIDTEHWRHYYWLIGMMWGLFAATLSSESRPFRWRIRQ